MLERAITYPSSGSLSKQYPLDISRVGLKSTQEIQLEWMESKKNIELNRDWVLIDFDGKGEGVKRKTYDSNYYLKYGGVN